MMGIVVVERVCDWGAVEKAKKERRPLFVVVGSKWCAGKKWQERAQGNDDEEGREG